MWINFFQRDRYREKQSTLWMIGDLWYGHVWRTPICNYYQNFTLPEYINDPRNYYRGILGQYRQV